MNVGETHPLRKTLFRSFEKFASRFAAPWYAGTKQHAVQERIGLLQFLSFSLGCAFGAKIALAAANTLRMANGKDGHGQTGSGTRSRPADARMPARKKIKERAMENPMHSPVHSAQMTFLTRAAMLGELSGALAHELSEPLAAILSNVKAAQRIMAAEPVDLHEVKDILDDIRADDQRASELIHRLRALYTKSEPTRDVVDLNQLVGETLRLTYRHLAEHRVKITPRLQPELAPVCGDTIQLQQVLLNLILNACDAMRTVAPDKRAMTLCSGVDQPGSIFLSISDTGSGIPVDAIDRLFSPFFSTKAEGMGLGLSISHSIIMGHGGAIEAMNNPEGGATFILMLPAMKSDMESLRIA